MGKKEEKLRDSGEGDREWPRRDHVDVGGVRSTLEEAISVHRRVLPAVGLLSAGESVSTSIPGAGSVSRGVSP